MTNPNSQSLSLQNTGSRIVTFNKPVAFSRHLGESDDEVWALNPGKRYVFTAQSLTHIMEHVETCSDLGSAPNLRPLQGGQNLSNARILVERYRDRGIGDLLFTTGPLAYMQHVCGHSARIHYYALSGRGQVFYGNPDLHNETALVGPLDYDSFQNYDFHWLIDTVSEYSEEPDQLNVYDALFAKLGLDHTKIEDRFKRPYAYLKKDDFDAFDALCFLIWQDREMDLRRSGYYVVAPLSHSSLRTSSYRMWLEVISSLADYRPVIVLGQITDRMPTTDMTVAEFRYALASLKKTGVVDLIGETPLRTMMAVISKATAVLCLDSAPLYLAQAFRTPAVSIWGPHNPAVRIGYDQDYMDLAIWQHQACHFAPCYAFSGFPVKKCPLGVQQRTCEVMRTVTPDMMMDKIAQIENRRPTLNLGKPVSPTDSIAHA